MQQTVEWFHPSDFPAVTRAPRATTVQANLGYVCNQTCFHCHVNAGPNRRETMDVPTLEALLAFIERLDAQTLDLTGGAPELNPNFRWLVEQARSRGLEVIDRCNLTILSEPGQEDLADFLAAHQVHVVASLPCYLEDNVDRQRGDGVFRRSLDGLRRLNARGYGQPGSGLHLDLVYNPQGAELPPPQAALEDAYRDALSRQWGIEFSQLLTIANMPINRFARQLKRDGGYEAYMEQLRASHSDSNLAKVMCRDLVSVDWQGYLYDCDFNQMLNIPLHGARGPAHVADTTPEDLAGRPVTVGDHCFGCTAGQGSSCSGAL